MGKNPELTIRRAGSSPGSANNIWQITLDLNFISHKARGLNLIGFLVSPLTLNFHVSNDVKITREEEENKNVDKIVQILRKVEIVPRKQ